MCGIVGFRTQTEAVNAQVILHQMCDAIAHRGPDGDGYFTNGNFGMGMRRLSIIDLAGGDQPISNEDSKLQIIYNGEIYNYRELRKQLTAKGHEFKTDSDTETVLHLFEEKGPGCVNELNGMFAFVIWDERQSSLFLARDRMGIKPLYYYWDGKTFVFASEIKAIAASGLVDLKLNIQAVWDYLTFRYVPQSESIWQNVYKLPPGHYLTFSHVDQAPRVERYWDIPYDDTVPQRAPQEYIDQFEELFLSAVQYHLIADVPVGVLLSGGIDSSAVAAAIAEVHNARLDSFSVAFKDSPGTDELRYARLVAKHTGTNHNEVVIGQQEFLDFLPQLVHFTDEPLADLASVPLYYVSQLARRHVKVVLSGEGSDEVLGGYAFERMQRIWDGLQRLESLPARIRQLATEIARPFVHGQRAEKLAWVSQPPKEWLRRTPFNMTHLFTETEKHELFGSMNSFDPSLNKVMDDTRRAKSGQPLHQALYTYCQSWLVEDLLMKADKMTMANSIELRVPFLDYRLVNWAAQSPTWVKVGGGATGAYESKWVLRRFAEKRLPSEIITRRKQGFPVPVYDWLHNDIKDWAWDTLSTSAKLTGWMDAGVVRGYLERGTSSSATTDQRHRLWLLLILELWLQTWQSK